MESKIPDNIIEEQYLDETHDDKGDGEHQVEKFDISETKPDADVGTERHRESSTTNGGVGASATLRSSDAAAIAAIAGVASGASEEPNHRQRKKKKKQKFNKDGTPKQKRGIRHKMSFASRNLDRGNKGYLDELEVAVRNFDKNGDGVYSLEEVFEIATKLENQRKKRYCLRKGLKSTICFSVILLFTLIGLMAAVIELTKEVSPDDSGNLVNHKNNEMVSTRSKGVKMSLTQMDFGEAFGAGNDNDNNRNLRGLQAAAAAASEGVCSRSQLLGSIDRVTFEKQWTDISDGTKPYISINDNNGVEKIQVLDGTYLQRVDLGDGKIRYAGFQILQPSSTSTLYAQVNCNNAYTNCYLYRTTAPTVIVTSVTNDSATFGFHTDFSDSKVQIIVSTDTHYVMNVKHSNFATTNSADSNDDYDCAGYVTMDGLASETQYYYKLVVDGVQVDPDYSQTFQTFPDNNNSSKQPSSSFKFVVLADAHKAPRDYTTVPTYTSAGKEGAIFALQIGDFGSRQQQALTTLSEFRTLHQDLRNTNYNQGYQFVTSILSKMSVYHTWNYHDYCTTTDDNDSSSCHSNAKQAFEEYYPNYPYHDVSDGIYYSFMVGNSAQIIMLDTRSNRSDSTMADTADKSMLGMKQKQWLKDILAASTAKVTFIISPITANALTNASGSDGTTWAQYQTEATEIKEFITTTASSNGLVVMISGDLHTSGAIDNGCHNLFGIPELNVGTTNAIPGVGSGTSSSGGGTEIGLWSEGVPDTISQGYAVVQVNGNIITLINKRSNGSEIRKFSINVNTFDLSNVCAI